MIYNFSKDSEYHTQINNLSIPIDACNTTSVIMASKQAGHKPIFTPEGVQPEDYYTDFLLKSPVSRERMETRYPWFVQQKIPANEVHEMLEWGINYLMTWDIDKFSMEVCIETFASKLLEGCGIVLSGLFPVKKKRLAHIVSLAGFITIDDDKHPTLDNISDFIIDDPRGNFRTDYLDVRGNDIRIIKEEFINIFKDTKSQTHKWAHVIRPAKPHQYDRFRG